MTRYFAFAKEASFNPPSPPTTPTRWLEISSEDISLDQQYVYVETVRERAYRHRLDGPQAISGSIDTPAFPGSAMTLLYYTLGSVTTTGTADPYTHTITPGNTIPSFSSWIGVEEYVSGGPIVMERKYNGMAISGVDIDYSAGEMLTLSFDVIAAKEATPGTTLQSPTFASDRPFSANDVVVTLGGSPSTVVESVSISIDNNIADDAFAIGSRILPALIVGRREITGSMDLRFASRDEYNNFLSGTTRSLVLDATIGANRQFKITLPKISYDTSNANIDTMERVVQGVDFTALWDDTSGYDIQIVVKNGDSNTQFVG